MKLRFLAKTLPTFPLVSDEALESRGTRAIRGEDARPLIAGETFTVEQTRGRWFLQNYPQDFEIVKGPAPEHNKMLRKTVQFKSK